MIIHKNTPKETALKFAKVHKAGTMADECKRCDSHCCKFSSAIFLDEDIERVAKFLGTKEDILKKAVLEEADMFNTKVMRAKRHLKPRRPYGPCVFLHEDVGCIIHEVKPLYCRIGNCDLHGHDLAVWFMLNHFVNPKDPESVRQYAIYLKTHPTIPGGSLEELVPDRKRLRDIMEFKELR